MLLLGQWYCAIARINNTGDGFSFQHLSVVGFMLRFDRAYTGVGFLQAFVWQLTAQRRLYCTAVAMDMGQ